jgi:hypothetical protein
MRLTVVGNSHFGFLLELHGEDFEAFSRRAHEILGLPQGSVRFARAAHGSVGGVPVHIGAIDMGINNASINWQDIPPERWRALSQFMRDTSASQALRPYTTYDPDLMAERAIEFSAPAEETRFGRAFRAMSDVIMDVQFSDGGRVIGVGLPPAIAERLLALSPEDLSALFAVTDRNGNPTGLGVQLVQSNEGLLMVVGRENLMNIPASAWDRVVDRLAELGGIPPEQIRQQRRDIGAEPVGEPDREIIDLASGDHLGRLVASTPPSPSNHLPTAARA